MSKQAVWTQKALRSPHEAADKAERVRRMFNAIAPRYELVNSLFSAGRDTYWRRKAVELTCVQSDDLVLDLACGTGDFARAFARAEPACIVGVDFAHEMLLRAAGLTPRGRTARRVARDLHWVEADALRLPFREGTFSIVSCAFGVRNFADWDAGLAEVRRILRPGGRAVILEFQRPAHGAFRRVFEFFSNHVMPIAATWVSSDRSGAYRYFPRSVLSFLTAEQMQEKLRAAGFADMTVTPLTHGIVAVHIARTA